MSRTRSPIRELYAQLCVLSPADELDDNLNNLPDYKELSGVGEARFCEWAYKRLSERSLCSGLLGIALRASEARKLAAQVGIPPVDLQGIDPILQLRMALERIGVREPTLPPRLQDGVLEMERLDAWFGRFSREIHDASKVPVELEGLSTRCRRGLERLLKVIALYLWDGSCMAQLKDVLDNGYKSGVDGRHNFDKNKSASADFVAWVMKQTAGPLNKLLKASSVSVASSYNRPVFLRVGSELWSDSAFDAVDKLRDAINDWPVHDNTHAIALAKLRAAARDVLDMTSGAHAQIRVPATIQFYRYYKDGYGDHYEGLTSDGKRICCFECECEYELHKPYIYLAATNPNAIDAVCTPLRPDLLSPVSDQPYSL